jgi:hypothetical protein
MSRKRDINRAMSALPAAEAADGRRGVATRMARKAANSRITSSQHEEAELPADGDSPCGVAIFSTRKTFRRSGIGLLTEYPAILEVIRLMLRSRFEVRGGPQRTINVNRAKFTQNKR